MTKGTCNSPLAWTAEDDTDGVPEVAEKFRACIGDDGALLKNSMLRGVREVFDRKVVVFAIASI